MAIASSVMASFRGQTSIIGLGVVTAFILWYATSAALAWRRLRKFPGPVLASFSYLWGFLMLISGNAHNIFLEVQGKYGRLVRIGPNELMTSDPETLSYINSARSSYIRGGWYAGAPFDPYGYDIVSEPDTIRHDKRKAQLASGYSGKGTLDLEKDVDSQLALLVDIIGKKYVGTGPDSRVLNFSRLLKFFQADLITLVGVGEPWGDLPTETDQFDFFSIMDSYVPFSQSCMMAPLLRNFIKSKVYLSLVGPKPTDTQGLGKFLGLVGLLCHIPSCRS